MESHGGDRDRDRDGDANGDVSPEINVGGGGGIDDHDDKRPLESTKGKGLKKWKRIQRRVSGASPTTTTTVDDLNRILKRDSRGGSAVPDSSHNSDTKSSTAASAPKFNYPLTHFRSTSTPPPPRHSFRHQNNTIETTKKLRGGGGGGGSSTLSYSSSVESDLRTPNLFFTDVTNATTTPPLSFDLDNTSDAHASDQHSNDYFFKDNGEEEDDASQDNDPASWQTKEQLTHNQPPPTTVNLLSQSIFSLQGVHDALLKEIQNFGEIGHEPVLLPDDLSQHFLLNQKFHSVVSEVHETNSSGKVHSEEIEKTSSHLPEAELLKVHQKVYILERKLEEARTMLEVKESKVVELEAVLRREFPEGEPRNSLQVLLAKCEEIETELEDLFVKKIEAEIECLTLRKVLQKLKVASEDKLEAFEEQKTVVGEQNKNLHESRHADGTNVARKEQGNKLAYTGDEVLKMHSGIWKYSLCFSIQLMLLLLAIGMLLMQLWPGSAGFVPT